MGDKPGAFGRVPRQLHVARPARDRYRFADSLFRLHSNAVFANFHAARVFAARMNEKRDLVHFPEQAIRAGQINAIGLIEEILHLVIRRYCTRTNPRMFADALEYLEQTCSTQGVDQVARVFSDEFPTLEVYRNQVEIDEYLAGETEGEPHRPVMLEELLLVWLANLNPAFAPAHELFDDERLHKRSEYAKVVDGLYGFFATQDSAGMGYGNLIDLLRAPALASPHSLEGQLDYIRRHWAELLGPDLYRLLSSLDLLAEENKAVFELQPGWEPPPDLGMLASDVEAFSPDKDWMPRVVMLAKNAFVWLDQLSRQYGQSIHRLDQVPDAELDLLANRGMTALWLIGLWQRSQASREIKQRMGNPDAVASAYSLEDYRIADDLGGEEAFEQLKARAWQRGIRIASDMVPNHVGIDSRWVIEHPDWFINLDYSPFPAYSFNGPDLCSDERVGVFIEDHYWNRSDAAVVFKRRDHYTGDERFVYHGNDGTSMPWNDTAQLDYRKPEVREAVIQTILHVARRSPIIRFDAAMTLTRQHYQRLWFPVPGSGGDIPSRADAGMTREQFDAAMPKEFWREVVDRVAAEAPDTLLLAEAFWLLEGYFVRTLGMHRVYNSAFMNMLRDERNSEYRHLIKSTLEFDPQILKRYVNFMSNPDERTAIDQFGSGDKYFGVCAMLATMPGLPMFGHGQIEGYKEKYGMEFRRSYWDESLDTGLVAHHERVIFPLLHRRYVFAEVTDFLLYDLELPDGSVDENVFAYSNRHQHERALVVYHNRYAETKGRLRISSEVAARQSDGATARHRRTLAQGLGLAGGETAFVILRDRVSGLEFLRRCDDLAHNGLYVELKAYELQVFDQIEEVADDETRQYASVCELLNGRGVPSIREAIVQLFLQPVLAPFRRLVSTAAMTELHRLVETEPEKELRAALVRDVAEQISLLGDAVREITGGAGTTQELVQVVTSRLEAVLDLSRLSRRHAAAWDAQALEAGRFIEQGLAEAPERCYVLFAWVFSHALGGVVDAQEEAELSRSWLDEWSLTTIVSDVLQQLGMSSEQAQRAVLVLKVMVTETGWFQRQTSPRRGALQLLEHLLQQREARAYLGVNRYRGVLWFNHECLVELVWWMMAVAAAQAGSDSAALTAAYRQVLALLEAEERSEFQVDQLLACLTEAEA